MSVLLVGMDVTIVNVALPAIQHDLRATLSGLQWILDAYTLVVASLLMLCGSLSDRFGRRRVFQIGLILFTAGSVLCSLAHSIHQLVAFRALQGLGASMLNPVALSIIANASPQPKARARAVGIWGGVAGVSMALGPLLGGALTESVGWRSIFWINLPIGLIAVALAARYVPESKAQRARLRAASEEGEIPRPSCACSLKAAHARAFDPVGQLMVFIGLASLTYAVIEGPRAGWTSPLIISLFAAFGCASVTFLRYEPRRTFLSQCPVQHGHAARCLVVLLFRGLSVSQRAVPAAGARVVGLSDRPLLAAPGHHDDAVLAAFRSNGGQVWHASFDAGRRGGLPAQYLTADRPRYEHAHRPGDGVLPVFRHRTRHGQPGYQQQRCGRHAAGAGGSRGGYCFHGPSGGSGAGCGDSGHRGQCESRAWARFYARNASNLVDYDGLRSLYLGAGLGVEYGLGESHYQPGAVACMRCG